MKLSAIRIERTLDQLQDNAILQDIYPLPDDNPVVSQLNELFGEHTFFLDSDGLHIVEPGEQAASAPTGKIVKLAAWRDGNRNALTPRQPEATGIVVVLGADEP